MARVTLDYTLVAAVLLTVIHYAGPLIRRGLRPRAPLVTSFGGGVAVAYVFLSLFPEMELAHEWLDDDVHFVTLVSFVLFYALETWLVLHRTELGDPGVGAVAGDDHSAGTGHTRHVFWWHIALSWLYTAMVIFALPEDVGENLQFAFVGSLAVGLHLLYKDYILRSHHHASYEEKGRILLASAPLVGWLAHQFGNPSEPVFDIFVAIVAGILMQGVFRDELPQTHAVRLRWMIGGVATFSVLTALTT